MSEKIRMLKQIQIMKISFRGTERDPWEGFVQSSEGRDTQALKVGGPERCCFLPSVVTGDLQRSTKLVGIPFLWLVVS